MPNEGSRDFRRGSVNPEIADYNVCPDCFSQQTHRIVDAGKLKKGVRVATLEDG